MHKNHPAIIINDNSTEKSNMIDANFRPLTSLSRVTKKLNEDIMLNQAKLNLRSQVRYLKGQKQQQGKSL